MAYPPPVTKKERKILEIVARGHPERTMNVRRSFASGTVNALEWTEIQIASGLSSNEFGDCIAHLVAGNLIDSGEQSPGLLGRLRGKDEQFFFWATELGHRFLADQSEDETPEEVVPPAPTEAKGEDIDDAVRIYEDSFSAKPYVQPDQMKWAETMLDEDIKSEIKRAALELEEMWAAFAKMFGHRSAASSEKEAAVRDPAVKRSVVRVFRAQDEQRRRRGFGTSQKPPAWPTHYNNGDVGLDPASWE